MTVIEKRQILIDYIQKADEAEVDAIYSDIVDNGEPIEYEWWNDEELMAELDRRVKNIEAGVDKGFTLEESKIHLLSRLRKDAR